MKHQEQNTHNHGLWMILACVLPMAFLLVLPALGVDIGAFWLLIPVLCVLSHLFMMRGHSHDDREHVHEAHPGSPEE